MKGVIILCTAFSFILGANFVIYVNKHREVNRSCAIEVKKGIVTTVHIGEWQ